MKPPPFEYLCPVDLDGVLSALAQDSEVTKILAGGQSLIPMMNLRMVAPRRLVDINHVPGLDRIDYRQMAHVPHNRIKDTQILPVGRRQRGDRMIVDMRRIQPARQARIVGHR